MAEIIDDVEYLTKEVGPHPAGTEEEQKAALYIADRMQKDAGFTTVVEDFQCTANDQLPTLICFGAALLSVLLSLVAPGLGFLWMLLGIAAAVLFGMEIMGKPILSRLFKTGASQNVVAKYQPASVGSSPRRRKIILVANYDSAKALQEEKPPFIQFLPIMQKASAVALAVSAVLLLFRSTLFSSDTGALSSVISFFLVICAILFVLPIVRSVLHIMAPYNQSANNNATGVSVMLEVAREVGNGLVSQEELMNQASSEASVVHGEEAARSAGLVPEGAEVSYEVDNMSPQESLAAAKAAIAALTGKPVADKVPVTDISSRLVKGGGLLPEDEVAASTVHFEESPQQQKQRKPRSSHLTREMVSATLDEEPAVAEEVEPVNEPVAEEIAAEAPAAPAQAPAPAPEPAAAQPFERSVPAALSSNPYSFSKPSGGTPSWAKAAREKARANKPQTAEPKVGRSRYADTVAAQIAEQQASSDSSNRYGFDAAQESSVDADLSSKLTALRDEIESVGAPRFSNEAAAEPEAVAYEPESTVAPAEQPAAATVAEVENSVRSAAPVSRETGNAPAAVSAEPLMEKAPAAASASMPAEPVAAANARTIDQDAIEQVLEHSAERNEAPKKPTVRQAASKPHKIHRIAEDLHAAREAERAAFDIHEQNEAVEAPSASATSPMGVVDEAVDSPDVTGELPASPAYADEPYGQSDYDEAAEYIDAMPYDDVAEEQEQSEDQPTSFLERTKQAGERMQNMFASRLKSVRKPSFMRKDESSSEEVDNYDQPYQEEYDGDETYEPSAIGENIVDEPVAPGKTAAIKPVDVSQFIDNEDFEDEGFTPVRRINEIPEQTAVPVMGSNEPAGGQYADDSYAYDGYADYGSVYPENEYVENQGRQAAASPIVGMDGMVPAPVTSAPVSTSKRQVIVLPEVASAHSSNNDGLRQRAPMADSAGNTQAGARSLLSNMLPGIDPVESSDNRSSKPALSLPSLGNTGSQQAVSTTGSFSTVGGTGSFAPVGDELVSDIAPEERYIDDADDSAYDEDYTENGAFAGAGYVDMPKSRAGRLFGRFRKKKNKGGYETSVNEWVDVDENYNARSVGKARGDWSSFQENRDSYGVNEPARNNRDWNGGAFSLDRLRKGQPAVAETPELQADGLMETNPAVRIDGDSQTAEQINYELKKLQEFRHPDIDTEVWFVALGAEHYSHSGMNAFLDEHAEELRGAVIVNLEALGAGTLSCIEEEGAYRPYKASSRLKRVLRQASEKSGVRYSVDKIVSRETPASVAMARGFHAITLAGMGEGNTALYSADNDIAENVNAKALNDAAKFTMALLKSF